MESGIAAQLYTVRDFLTTPADIAVALRRIKQIGYPAVQLSGLGPIETKELASILRGEGLVAAATHVGIDEIQRDLPRIIDEHHLLQCKHTAIAWLPGEYHNAEGYARFARIGSEYAKKLGAEGISLSYHNHSFEFEKYDGKTGLQIIYELADPLLKAEIDTYWVQHGGGNPVSWLKLLNGRMTIVHLKDLGIVNSEQVMAEVGEGNLDWPAIISACQQAGVKWYAVEQDTCRRDPFESLAISLRNLKDMGLPTGV